MAAVLIGADICPIGGNQPSFLAGDAPSLFNDLLPDLERADLVLANLECPLIEHPSPILKTGPTFGEAGACIDAIRQAGIDVLCLANNHVMDHGAAGLENTLQVCSRAGIFTVGAGENVAAARRILVKQCGPIRVGIVAMAEHEFSIAGRKSWGANPLDVIEFVRRVNSDREEFDYLIVLVHGGDEFCVPTPRLQQTCRFMIEMGANAVIVQHPHVLGGCEQYRGGHIVYGQGALIMDEAIYRNRPSFHEGFLVKLRIADDASSAMEIIPFVQSDPVPGARRMSSEREAKFRRGLEDRSKAIRDDGFVEAEWLRFCRENRDAYLSGILGYGRVRRKLNKGGWLTRLMHGKRELLGVRNLVCCETHREALETIFNNGMV
jgi:poly-gamma-glutamate capsule biosynthesis protein CapA/YwtB (metallophosphatase superfamily)